MLGVCDYPINSTVRDKVMAISEFRELSDKIFNRLIESFPVSKIIHPNDIVGPDTITIERGREVDKDPDETQKVRDTLQWLVMNGYVHASGDYYSLSEKWLKLKRVDFF